MVLFFKKERLPSFAALLLCAAAPSTVTVTTPWARATAPHQQEAAIYLTLTSPTADTLQSIDSDDGMAMLHRSVARGDQMQDMEEMENLPLPAGKPVKLSPRGMHIMLMAIPHPLVAGGEVHLILHFAKAGDVRVTAPVLPIGSRGP